MLLLLSLRENFPRIFDSTRLGRCTPQKRKSFNPNYNYFQRASATTYYPLDKSGLVVL